MKEEPGYKLSKRLQRSLLRPLGLWRRKHYDIRFISREGKLRYKKVIFNNASRAIKASSTLEAYGRSPHFPTLIGRQRNTVWVAFVHGAPLESIDGKTFNRLADFYAAIYRRRSRLMSLNDTSVWSQFEDNLVFLYEQSHLRPDFLDEIRAKAKAVAPGKVWIGFDYTDPIKNNLVQREGREAICAVDIKNLRADTLMGRGLAKARRRWLLEPTAFLERLRHRGAPDLEPYFPFIELVDRVQRIRGKLSAGRNGIKRTRYLKRESRALSKLLDS